MYYKKYFSEDDFIDCSWADHKRHSSKKRKNMIGYEVCSIMSCTQSPFNMDYKELPLWIKKREPNELPKVIYKSDIDITNDFIENIIGGIDFEVIFFDYSFEDNDLKDFEQKYFEVLL